MKTLNIITHPYAVIISFFLILISGQHLGGFYLLYLLLALPHGGVHSIFAVFGIVMLLVSYNKYKRKKAYAIESIMNISGILFLILSLFFFFYNDKRHYNYGTFDQLVPQISLIIFFLMTFAFIIENLMINAKLRKPS